jgi:N-acetylmuramoyl-L-alanine amidase
MAMNKSFLHFIFACALIGNFSAQAYELENVRGYVESWAAAPAPSPASEESVAPDSARLEKFNLALETIGIPAEAAPDFSAFPAAQTLSENDINARLPYIDPDQGLRRYLNLTPTSLSLFRDFFSSALPANLLEYALNLTSQSAPTDSETLIAHLQQISNQVKDPNNAKPLSGLKVLIDPGHMGTSFWDVQTGKFMQVNGRKVSEGMINLWTAFLVANELEDLGATVTLTRTQAAPVTPENYQSFDTTPYLNQYFYDSQDDWMAKYLKLPDPTLKATIKQKPEVIKAFGSYEHDQYFIEGADLSARSDLIDQSHPDIVFDIHYDANRPDQLQNTIDALEAFVPGGWGATETGSRLMRNYAMKQLLDINRWQASVDLATDVVQAMAESEQIPLENEPRYITSVKVKNGVYARNLYITRRNLSSLMVYLECLHYDHTNEFYKLAVPNQVGDYHGVSFEYPARIRDVANGIRSGILNYFKR